MFALHHFNLIGLTALFMSLATFFIWSSRSALSMFRQSASLAALLVTAFSANIFSFVATVMARNPSAGNARYVSVFFTIALVSIIIFPYCLTIYSFDQTGGRINKIILAIPPAVLTFAALAFNRQSGIFFTLDGDTFAYRRGPLAYAVYALFGAYMLLVAAECYKKRRYMSEARILASLFAFALGFASLAVSIVTEDAYNVLAGSMGVAVGILVIVFHCVDVSVNPLTGLKNEKGFDSAGKYLLATSPDDFIFAFIDVYYLRRVNEIFSYHTGNAFLIKYAERLAEQYKGVPSVLGRFDSGFAVLVRERDFKFTPEDAKIYLREFLDMPECKNYAVTLYCGVCPVKDKSMSLWRILKRARYALATIYGDFQKHIAWFEGDIEKRYDNDRFIAHKSNTAIDMTEFRVVLQPIVDAQTGKVCSAEALVRWYDKELGVVPPGDFIPTFEKTGFVAKLDKYILESVCRLIADMKVRGLKPVPVSVNISRADVENETLADEIMAIVDAHGVEHSLIKIEITESAFSDKDKVLENAVNRLRDAGFLVLMDDFGSGYSNFAMFQKASCDIIKLDMKFLYGVGGSDKSDAVFKAIVRLTHDLKLPTVVEGVETKEQYEFVKALDCDMIQGYYFSKPLPYEEFVKMLE